MTFPLRDTRDEEKDMEAAAEKAALERGKRLTKRGAAAVGWGRPRKPRRASILGCSACRSLVFSVLAG